MTTTQLTDMSAAYTRGPWEIRVVPGMKGTAIAPVDNMHPVCWIDDRPDGKHEANARLIAAAPELLAALKAIVADVPEIEGYWTEGFDNTMRGAEGLIARLEDGA